MRGSLSPTSANGTITIVRGQDAAYTLTVEDDEGERVDLTDATIEFEVRGWADQTGEPLIHKDTETDGGVTLLAQDEPGTEGQAIIALEPADTTATTDAGEFAMLRTVVYTYDVWITMDDVRTPLVRPRDLVLLGAVTAYEPPEVP